MNIPLIKNKKNLVFVLGSSATALAIVRELKDFENLVIYVASTQVGSACVSRHVTKHVLLKNLDELSEHIINLSHSYHIALMPSSDLFVEWMVKNASELEKHCSMDDCYSSQLALDFLDKDVFSEIITQNSLTQPMVESVFNFDQLEKKYFPVFIKPKMIHKKKDSMPGKKGIIIKNNKQWKDWLSIHQSDLNDWLVQEIILGSEDNIMLSVTYRDNNRKIIDTYCARKIRQFPSGFGSASLVLTQDDDSITKIAHDLLNATNYKGVCSGEYKWCKKRKNWVVIEFNPRPALWFYAGVASGHQIVSQAIANLLKIKMPDPKPKKCILWKYGLKDIFSRVFYIRNKDFILGAPQVNKYLKGLDYKKAYPVFAIDDLKPFFTEIWIYFKKGLKRFGG